MVSKVVCTSSAGAIKYFENHLNVADYFTESETVDRGEFIGKVAERLGLDEEAITREKFIAFAECDMIGLGADSKRQRASEIKYIEFTYSPPKAVSVVAAMDDRVKGELYAAVKQELSWFEQQVTVRDRRGNLANEEMTKPTGRMIVPPCRFDLGEGRLRHIDQAGDRNLRFELSRDRIHRTLGDLPLAIQRDGFSIISPGRCACHNER